MDRVKKDLGGTITKMEKLDTKIDKVATKIDLPNKSHLRTKRQVKARSALPNVFSTHFFR
jgi:hypothetical protein